MFGCAPTSSHERSQQQSKSGHLSCEGLMNLSSRQRGDLVLVHGAPLEQTFRDLTLRQKRCKQRVCGFISDCRDVARYVSGGREMLETVPTSAARASQRSQRS